MKIISIRHYLQFCLILVGFIGSMSIIHAEEELPPVNIITVELNSEHAADEIKTQLVELELQPELKKEINIDQSELLIEGLDISKLGLQEVNINLHLKSSGLRNNLFENVITKKIMVEVKDTTAPVITLKSPKVILDFEEELNVYKWIDSIEDNSLLEVTNIQVDMSSLDISTPGNYEVYISAFDESNNQGRAILNVTVKKKKVAYSYYGTSSDSISGMLEAINSVRSENGLSSLTLGDENAQAAIGIRACEAASNTSHTRPDGRHYKTAFDDYGVSYSSPYEILTYSGSTVADKLNWWLNSPNHRAIVLRKSGTKIAIGYCGKMWAAIVYN